MQINMALRSPGRTNPATDHQLNRSMRCATLANGSPSHAPVYNFPEKVELASWASHGIEFSKVIQGFMKKKSNTML